METTLQTRGKVIPEDIRREIKSMAFIANLSNGQAINSKFFADMAMRYREIVLNQEYYDDIRALIKEVKMDIAMSIAATNPAPQVIAVHDTLAK